MTTYDAAMVIVVVLGMVRGAWRGFTWQIASITSLVLGYTAAHTASARVASYLPGEPEVQRMLAMGVVYVAVSGGIFGIAWMIRGTLRKLKFEAFDRHLGMLLGGVEGMGVGLLATMFVVSLAPATRQPIFSSKAGHVVGAVMNNLGPVLPGEVRSVLAPHWDGSLTETVATHDADHETGESEEILPTSGQDAVSSELPALREADADDSHSTAPAAAFPGLPALVPVGKEDRAVERASRSAHAARHPSPEGPSGQTGLEGVIEKGREEVEHAVSETIDNELQRLGGLKSAAPKGRR